ncbi:MAG TPA: carboxypeptidase-like regulatory domain-containing protein, partial [Chitinophagaceae bacterium]|nr:carboxypeptidase-like regulatory domain-containing protein [Chitinophagaceae bacterium]
MARGQTGDPRKVKVTLSVKNKKASQVLDQIRQQYDLQLIYPSNIDLLTQPVNFSLKDASLDDAMSSILKNSKLEYVTEGMVVLVREASKQETTAPNEKKPGDLPTATSEQPAHDITGRITDSQGRPLQGASVQVSGSQRGTSTNENGVFELRNVDENTVLIISMTGYRQKTVRVGQSNTLAIILEESPSDLDQVIVTGYMAQKRRSVTGSIVSVKGRDIENVPLQSFDKAIQGRAAGVLVQSQTGVPGGAVRINIRGVGSISAGTDP